MTFLDFSDFGRDVYRTHGRHSGSSAMQLAEIIHEIWLKIINTKFPENFYFFDEKYFSKDFEKSKISKSHFFKIFEKSFCFSEKVDFFEKAKIFEFFFEKVDFLKILSFSTKIEKSDFLKFSIFQNRSKNIFHRKNNKFSVFFFFFLYRSSCITSSSGIAELPLCRPWARLTSPPKIRKFTF